jgi:alpha-1,6-mannosyltransferase
VVVPLGVGGAMWAFKAVGALATFGCVLLAWRIAQLLGRDPLRAAVLIGLNPLVLVFAVGGGHNDALVALPILAGTWLVLRERHVLGGAAIASAAAVKLSAGIVLPFLLLGGRRRVRVTLGIVAAGVVLLAIGLLAFGPSMTRMLDALHLQERFGYGAISLNGFPRHYLHLGRAGPDTKLAMKAIFAGVSAVLAVRCIWTRNWLAAAGWSTLVLLATMGWVLPWYALWLLPLAALARSRFLVPATVALTLAITGIWAAHYLHQAQHHRHHRHHHIHHVHVRAPGPARFARAQRGDVVT